MLPETESALKLVISPVAMMSPDTVWAVMRPTWLPTEISPETPESSRSPSWLSMTSSPETVLSFASPSKPETSASPETTPSCSTTWRGARIETSALALPAQPLKASMKLSQRSWGWSISSTSPSMETASSLPVTVETSTRAPGSSCAMTSTLPPMRLTLSLRTSSRSMIRDSPGAITHFSMDIAAPCWVVTLVTIFVTTRYIAFT